MATKKTSFGQIAILAGLAWVGWKWMSGEEGTVGGKRKYIVLGSVVSGGVLVQDDLKYITTTYFNSGERYEGQVVTFNNTKEAFDFIERNGFWALEPIEVTKDFFK